MGLFLRLNLFYGVTAPDVYAAYARFYGQRGRSLLAEGEESRSYTLYEPSNHWTVLQWEAGWEWVERREAQGYVSRELDCPGFLIFVFDGGNWGYEFFHHGATLDCFVQDEEDGQEWFPTNTSGRADRLVENLPFLDHALLQRYLVHKPGEAEMQATRLENESWLKACNRLRDSRNIKPQGSDQFLPFEECFVVDFINFLGVRVELRAGHVTLLAPSWRNFWISGQNENI